MNTYSPEQQASQQQARKRFGQNFLSNSATIENIIAVIQPQADDNIIEIGPGLGALTQHLLQSQCQLQVVELDRDLAANLHQQYPALRLVEADALKTDFAALAGEQAAKIVGNLPYNISTPLLFHLLGFKAHTHSMYFMLQKEVVDRMGAEPGNKSYGRLSVALQYHYRIEAMLQIPPSAFHPAPKVHSAFVKLTPREFPLQAHDEKHLQQLLHAVFNQRRKTLRNTLKQFCPKQVTALPEDLLKRRPETLSVEEFVQLSNNIVELQRGA